jgi:hypothetical protein
MNILFVTDKLIFDSVIDVETNNLCFFYAANTNDALSILLGEKIDLIVYDWSIDKESLLNQVRTSPVLNISRVKIFVLIDSIDSNEISLNKITSFDCKILFKPMLTTHLLKKIINFLC